MSLTTHARRELTIAGLFREDSDYDGDLAKAVMALIEVFSHQGHSGASAHAVLQLFNKVARFENLAPLNDDIETWNEVGDDTWQSQRNSSCFSNDAGRTYYSLEEEKVDGKWVMHDSVHVEALPETQMTEADIST